jgi:hypothetical protein
MKHQHKPLSISILRQKPSVLKEKTASNQHRNALIALRSGRFRRPIKAQSSRDHYLIVARIDSHRKTNG